MGNAYSEERFDEEARLLIVQQTAADLEALVDVDYCRQLLRTLVDLLHSVSFPAHFVFKGAKMKAGVASLHLIANYYLKVAQCLSALIRTTSPKYLVGDKLTRWQEYEGGGALFEEGDVGYFFHDQYDLATGTYKKSEPQFDQEQWSTAFAERAHLFGVFSDLLRFPPNLKMENFRKLLVEFEPFEKWLDLYFEQLQFHLTTNRIRSLLKI